MKRNTFIIVIFCCYTLSSCSSWVRIGTLTMASTRNIDTHTDYKELARYVEGTDKGKTRIYNSEGGAKTVNNGKIDAAIDNTVSSISGGEFLKNVQILTKDGRIKVIGDVWGISVKDDPSSQYEIVAGDYVMWKLNSRYIKGKVVGIEKDALLIKYNIDSEENYKKIKRDELTKITTADFEEKTNSKTEVIFQPKIINEAPSKQKTAPDTEQRQPQSIQEELHPKTDNGFAVGDSVSWEGLLGHKTGTIISLKESGYGVVQFLTSLGVKNTGRFPLNQLTKIEK